MATAVAPVLLFLHVASMSGLDVPHVRRPTESPHLLDTAVDSVHFVGSHPFCGFFCCHCGGRSVEEPPDTGVPPSFIDIYSADEWAAFASQINRVLQWTLLPFCPCFLALPLWCCCICVCQCCRTESLTNLLARENHRLKQQSLEWLFDPSAESFQITLRWDPMTRHTWEFNHPHRRKITAEAAKRTDAEANGTMPPARPERPTTSPTAAAAHSVSSVALSSVAIVPGGPSPPPQGSAPRSAVRFHRAAAPLAPPPPHEPAMEQQSAQQSAHESVMSAPSYAAMCTQPVDPLFVPLN